MKQEQGNKEICCFQEQAEDFEDSIKFSQLTRKRQETKIERRENKQKKEGQGEEKDRERMKE